MSRSLRARGLKLYLEGQTYCLSDVALFTGAWIETLSPCVPYPLSFVALFTGAWIETISLNLPTNRI